MAVVGCRRSDLDMSVVEIVKDGPCHITGVEKTERSDDALVEGEGEI